MPRPNRVRTMVGEESLARRIAYERERRVWSYEGLAVRMTNAGCAINGSALYKIEKGSPRRRITVDELVALAAVFEASMDELLTSPEALETLRALELVEVFASADRDARQARAAWRVAGATLWAYLEEHPDARARLETLLKATADDPDDPGDFFSALGQSVEELLGEDVDLLESAEIAAKVHEFMSRTDLLIPVPLEPKDTA